MDADRLTKFLTSWHFGDEVVVLDEVSGESWTPSKVTAHREGDGPTIVYLEW